MARAMIHTPGINPNFCAACGRPWPCPDARESAVASTSLPKLTGLTYRQVDHWARTDLLAVCPGTLGKGFPRRHPASEVTVLRLVGRLLQAGFKVPDAFKAARRMHDDGLGNVRLPGDLALIDLTFDRPRRHLTPCPEEDK